MWKRKLTVLQRVTEDEGPLPLPTQELFIFKEPCQNFGYRQDFPQHATNMGRVFHLAGVHEHYFLK